MEQTVHTRPKIEEVTYSPQLQVKKYLKFSLTVIEEHSTELSELDLLDIDTMATEISSRCFEIIGRRK
jgi:hypothetical protein